MSSVNDFIGIAGGFNLNKIFIINFESPGLETIAIAEYEGPVYLRFGRPVVPVFTAADQKFEIGKAWLVNEGKDVSIFATGHLVWEALIAAETLEARGISAEGFRRADGRQGLRSARLAGADCDLDRADGGYAGHKVAMTVWRTGGWRLQIVKRSNAAGFEVLPSDGLSKGHSRGSAAIDAWLDLVMPENSIATSKHGARAAVSTIHGRVA